MAAQLMFVPDGRRLIECTALAKLPLLMAQKKALHASLDENLKHPAAAIQSQAAMALCAFCKAYISKASPEALARTTVKHLQVRLPTLEPSQEAQELVYDPLWPHPPPSK